MPASAGPLHCASVSRGGSSDTTGDSVSSQVYAATVEEPVVVKVVSGESEAELVCGLLRSAGIECGYRDTEAVDSQFEEFIASGPREIIVHRSDLEAAQALVGEAAS